MVLIKYGVIKLLTLRKITLLSLILLVTGCAVPVDRYHATADNQVKIKTFKHKLAVEQFTATKTHYKVQCRLANNVEMTDGRSFQGYIQDALIEELKMAGAYSKDSNIIIKGHLNDTDVSSGVTDAHWTFDLTVSNAKGESYTINYKREYRASLMGGIACRDDMPKSFLPTVQELIGAIINHPGFNTLFGVEAI